MYDALTLNSLPPRLLSPSPDNSLVHAGLVTVKDLLQQLFGSLWGYGLVGLGFLGFLVYNGGIVIGDKEAHVSVFHLPQVIRVSMKVVGADQASCTGAKLFIKVEEMGEDTAICK